MKTDSSHEIYGRLTCPCLRAKEMLQSLAHGSQGQHAAATALAAGDFPALSLAVERHSGTPEVEKSTWRIQSPGPAPGGQ